MNVISTNIGLSKKYIWKNKEVFTAIKKRSVDAIITGVENVDSDQITNRKYHGGINKALYSFDESEYDYWKSVLDFQEWHYGILGENITTQGVFDEQVKVGNIYQIGTAKVQAIQCRFPCMKLNVVLNDSTMLKSFLKRRKFGIYYKVIEKGSISKGANFELIEESKERLTIHDIANIRTEFEKSKELIEQASESQYLPEGLKLKLKDLINK